MAVSACPIATQRALYNWGRTTLYYAYNGIPFSILAIPAIRKAKLARQDSFGTVSQAAKLMPEMLRCRMFFKICPRLASDRMQLHSDKP